MPVVQQRASRQRAEVPALDRRVRGRARRGRRVRRRPRRRRRRLRPQHDGGDQRPVGRAARGHARALERGRASLQHASLAAPRSPAAAVHRLARRAAGARASGRFGARGRGSTWSPSPAPRTSPGRCGRSPSSPSSPTLTARSCSSTPRSSPRTAASTWPARASTSWRSRATSSTRRSAPARWSATRRRLSEREPLLHGGGAIELVTLDDVDLGGRARSATRPARRTSSAPSRSPRPAARLLDARDGHRRRARTGALGTPVERAVRRPGTAKADALARRRRPRRRRHLQPRRLPASAARRHPERRARDRRPPRLLLRAPAHDAAARHTGRARSTASQPSCARDGVPPSRAPSGPASGSAPRPTTSTA